jgi:hypothetical protein
LSPGKKRWIRPSTSSLEAGVFKSWDRDKLQHVRDLVHQALELIEASGQAPDAETRLRAFLDQIDAELAE